MSSCATIVNGHVSSGNEAILLLPGVGQSISPSTAGAASPSLSASWAIPRTCRLRESLPQQLPVVQFNWFLTSVLTLCAVNLVLKYCSLAFSFATVFEYCALAFPIRPGRASPSSSQHKPEPQPNNRRSFTTFQPVAGIRHTSQLDRKRCTPLGCHDTKRRTSSIRLSKSAVTVSPWSLSLSLSLSLSVVSLFPSLSLSLSLSRFYAKCAGLDLELQSPVNRQAFFVRHLPTAWGCETTLYEHGHPVSTIAAV